MSIKGADGNKSPSHRKETTGGAWGSTRPRTGPTSGGPTYSSITSINTSIRDSKNILEIRLEKQAGATFNLTMMEAENLCKRLSIDSTHVLGCSACPEGRPAVLITLHPSTDITRFLYRNESYIVKEGVRTTTIRPEGRKDKVIKITGLHPNTKDQAVVKYLSAHGVVSTKDKVIHHVFPGQPGSSLLAGKLNGNRSYVMEELKVPLGSYHIIDGEKVSVRYSGQEWTCARCHQAKSNCPGAAVARDCTAERILLSSHMVDHWQRIGYKPDTDTMNAVDESVELEVQVGGLDRKTINVPESTNKMKYNSVIVGGFRLETDLASIKEVLNVNGLPVDHLDEDITRNSKTGSLTVNNLKPETCMNLTSSMNKKNFLGRQIFVKAVVGQSPSKVPPSPAITKLVDNVTLDSPPRLTNPPLLTVSTSRTLSNADPEIIHPCSGVDKDSQNRLTDPPPKVPTPSPSPDPLQGFVFGLVSPGVQDKIHQIEGLKRKSECSPDSDPLTRKEKKLIREEEKKKKKLEKKQENKKLAQDVKSCS